MGYEDDRIRRKNKHLQDHVKVNIFETELELKNVDIKDICSLLEKNGYNCSLHESAASGKRSMRVEPK